MLYRMLWFKQHWRCQCVGKKKNVVHWSKSDTDQLFQCNFLWPVCLTSWCPLAVLVVGVLCKHCIPTSSCVCVRAGEYIYFLSSCQGCFGAIFACIVCLGFCTHGLETGLMWKLLSMIRVTVRFLVLLNWVSLKAEVARIHYKWSKGTVIIVAVHNQWTIGIFSMKTYTWINKPKISWPRGDERGDNHVWGYIRCRECPS